MTASVDEYRAAEAKAMTELALQRRIIRMAKEAGWLCYHTWNSQHSAAGFPDLCLVSARQKRVVFAELKKQGKKPTLQQVLWLRSLEAADAESYLWQPIDLLNGTIAAVLSGEGRAM